MNYIAFDSHKRYTLASVERESGGLLQEARIEHGPGAIKDFLARWDKGSPVAVETLGNWYWIVDEIEAAGMVPRLVHARKAKLMMASANKTDTLDARGLNRLQRTGTLPSVWIAPRELRDQRELPRTRMVLTRERARLKNRIQATLAKYALSVEGVSDLFGKKGGELLRGQVSRLPAHARFATEQLLEQLALTQRQIGAFEERMRGVFEDTPEHRLLQSLPGVGFILATVILTETGDIGRFCGAGNYASYAGTTPRVHSSGGKTRFGPLRSDANSYLKWAFVEAANVVCLNRRRWPGRHVAQFYSRIHRRKGHQKAIGAVARHLAESTFWMLTRKEEYRDPASRTVVSIEG